MKLDVFNMINIIKKYNSLSDISKILINCKIAELTLVIIKDEYPEDYRFEKLLLDVHNNLSNNKSIKDIIFNIWNIDTSKDIHLERTVNVFVAIPFFEIDDIIEEALTAISQYEFLQAWRRCGDRVNATYKSKHVIVQSIEYTKVKILDILNSYED